MRPYCSFLEDGDHLGQVPGSEVNPPGCAASPPDVVLNPADGVPLRDTCQHVALRRHCQTAASATSRSLRTHLGSRERTSCSFLMTFACRRARPPRSRVRINASHWGAPGPLSSRFHRNGCPHNRPTLRGEPDDHIPESSGACAQALSRPIVCGSGPVDRLPSSVIGSLCIAREGISVARAGATYCHFVVTVWASASSHAAHEAGTRPGWE
jgi:hypothetical protein